MLDILYEAGIRNLNDFFNMDYRNIGHIAVAENAIELVTYLKRKTHFDFYRKDRWGKTPIDEA
jgi:lysophospholipase